MNTTTTAIQVLDLCMRALVEVGQTPEGRAYLSAVGMGITERTHLLDAAESYSKKFENKARRASNAKEACEAVRQQIMQFDLFLQMQELMRTLPSDTREVVFRYTAPEGIAKIEVLSHDNSRGE